MARTAVATGDEPDRPAPRPPAITLPDVPQILVTINCPEAIPTFRPSNPLHKQFGFTGFIRVDAELPNHLTVEPNPNAEGVFQPFFQDDPEGLTWARLSELRQQPDWLVQLIHERINRQIVAQLRDGGFGGYVQKVTAVVLASNWRMVDDDPKSIVRRALQPNFPQATFYMADPEDGCEVQEIWNDKSCPECLMEMRPAGSAYVCEHCGHTKPRTEPPLTADQPEGEDPTEEKVDPPPAVDVPDEPEEYGLCGHCGGKMKLEGDEYICLNCGRTKRRTGPETVTE